MRAGPDHDMSSRGTRRRRPPAPRGNTPLDLLPRGYYTVNIIFRGHTEVLRCLWCLVRSIEERGKGVGKIHYKGSPVVSRRVV